MTESHAGSAEILIEARDIRQVVRVMVRRGAEEEFARRIRKTLALELPSKPERACREPFAVVGVAPGAWLVTDAGSSEPLMDRLKAATGSTAGLCDLSDAYVFRRVAGAKARAALAKLIPVDLHARQFPVGAAASTLAAHVSVLLWRLADAGADPCFEIGVPRSYAGYVYEALAHAAATTR